jgi:hypothetical protein
LNVVKLFTCFLLLSICGSLQSVASPLHAFSESPPSELPLHFALPVPSGFVAAERLVISQDSTQIFYSLVNGYEPDSHTSIQYIEFVDGVWTDPVTLVEGYNSPVISEDGNTLYVEGKNSKDVWALKRGAYEWSEPLKLYSVDKERHYFTELASGSRYYSSLDLTDSKARDIFVSTQADADEPSVALGLASKIEFPKDFFIAGDESYIITTHNASENQPLGEVVVYFRGQDDSWSSPKSIDHLFEPIKASWKWGFYVSPDNKYLFFTAGDSLEDTKIYWLEFSAVIQRLKRDSSIGEIKPNSYSQDVAVFGIRTEVEQLEPCPTFESISLTCGASMYLEVRREAEGVVDSIVEDEPEANDQ